MSMRFMLHSNDSRTIIPPVYNLLTLRTIFRAYG